MKQHTIIFVPHARAKFRKWRLTTLQVAIALGSLALLTVGGIVSTIFFYKSSIDREHLAQLEAENVALREVNQGFEGSVRDLETQVEDYQQRIHKLAIVAGLSELSPSREAGIGGMAPTENEVGEGDLNGELLSLQAQLQQMGVGMDVLQEKLEKRQVWLSATPAVTPVKGLLTSGFGFRRDPFTQQRAFHRGIDIVAPHGKEIRATGDGIVTKSGRTTGLGTAVFLSHGFGIMTRYGHMSKVHVKAGQRVKRGDVIGYVGSTGRSTGNHVHYEVYIDGKAVDPLGYILDSIDS